MWLISVAYFYCQATGPGVLDRRTESRTSQEPAKNQPRQYECNIKSSAKSAAYCPQPQNARGECGCTASLRDKNHPLRECFPRLRALCLKGSALTRSRQYEPHVVDHTALRNISLNAARRKRSPHFRARARKIKTMEPQATAPLPFIRMGAQRGGP